MKATVSTFNFKPALSPGVPYSSSSSLLLLVRQGRACASRSMSMSMSMLSVTTRSSAMRSTSVSCEAALLQQISDSKAPPVPPASSPSQAQGCLEGTAPVAVTGARVRVKVPALKVYHVPRVPEVDLAGMEGTVKQHVGVYRGTEVSPNLPFKVEFVLKDQITGRGGNRAGPPVKFSAHLKQDEFEYI